MSQASGTPECSTPPVRTGCVRKRSWQWSVERMEVTAPRSWAAGPSSLLLVGILCVSDVGYQEVNYANCRYRRPGPPGNSKLPGLPPCSQAWLPARGPLQERRVRGSWGQMLQARRPGQCKAGCSLSLQVLVQYNALTSCSL